MCSNTVASTRQIDGLKAGQEPASQMFDNGVVELVHCRNRLVSTVMMLMLSSLIGRDLVTMVTRIIRFCWPCIVQLQITQN